MHNRQHAFIWPNSSLTKKRGDHDSYRHRTRSIHHEKEKLWGWLFARWAGFVALMIWHRPGGLLFITCVSGLAWCASMLFNQDEPLQPSMEGSIDPTHYRPGVCRGALCRIAGNDCGCRGRLHSWCLESLIWFRDGFGNRFYMTWSQLFLPLAWSVSTLLLVLVYYGVLTPIGVIVANGRPRSNASGVRPRRNIVLG